MSSGNSYLNQVVAQQERLEADLRSKRSAPAPAAHGPGPGRADPRRRPAAGGPACAERGRGAGHRVRPVEDRDRAAERVRRAHPARPRSEPLHIGLGMSFRYNPATDSYLVVPGAMQTILINAYCICRELQGVLVQAYVQWIIEDFSTAYRKLDFGDVEDPMRLVNLQLKEQAEAAIKDKVATHGRARRAQRQAADHRGADRPAARPWPRAPGGGDRGLGLRIVTVQIKEAVVSSSRLWENLQKPYRSEQGRIARLAELAAERGDRRAASSPRPAAPETQQIENDRELAELRARNDAAAFDREAGEQLRRAEREQEDARRLAELQNETTLHALALERDRDARGDRGGPAARRTRSTRCAGWPRRRARPGRGSRAESAARGRCWSWSGTGSRAEIDNDQSPAEHPGEVDRLAARDRGQAAEARGTARRHHRRQRHQQRWRPFRRARRRGRRSAGDTEEAVTAGAPAAYPGNPVHPIIAPGLKPISGSGDCSGTNGADSEQARGWGAGRVVCRLQLGRAEPGGPLVLGRRVHRVADSRSRHSPIQPDPGLLK